MLSLLIVTLGIGCGEQDAPVPMCESMTPPAEIESCVVELDETINASEQLQSLCTSKCDTLKRLYLSGNQISSLRPLKNIRHVQSKVAISVVGSLVRLDGLENIQSVGKALPQPTGLDINSLDLVSFKGFDSLVEVHGTKMAVAIQANQTRELDGFPELKTLHGGLAIVNNYELRRITGFPKLKTVEGDLVIWGNENLPRCEIDAFVAGIDTIEGEVDIRDNGSGSCD
jgi:hypothetical protein